MLPPAPLPGDHRRRPGRSSRPSSRARRRRPGPRGCTRGPCWTRPPPRPPSPAAPRAPGRPRAGRRLAQRLHRARPRRAVGEVGAPPRGAARPARRAASASKSSGGVRAYSRVKGCTTARRHAALRRSSSSLRGSRVISLGASSGCSTLPGCGWKVSAAGRPCGAASAKSAWWPRWTPSKLPSASAQPRSPLRLPRSGGRPSSPELLYPVCLSSRAAMTRGPTVCRPEPVGQELVSLEAPPDWDAGVRLRRPARAGDRLRRRRPFALEYCAPPPRRALRRLRVAQEVRPRDPGHRAETPGPEEPQACIEADARVEMPRHLPPRARSTGDPPPVPGSLVEARPTTSAPSSSRTSPGCSRLHRARRAVRPAHRRRGPRPADAGDARGGRLRQSARARRLPPVRSRGGPLHAASGATSSTASRSTGPAWCGLKKNRSSPFLEFARPFCQKGPWCVRSSSSSCSSAPVGPRRKTRPSTATSPSSRRCGRAMTRRPSPTSRSRPASGWAPGRTPLGSLRRRGGRRRERPGLRGAAAFDDAHRGQRGEPPGAGGDPLGGRRWGLGDRAHGSGGRRVEGQSLGCIALIWVCGRSPRSPFVTVWM